MPILFDTLLFPGGPERPVSELLPRRYLLRRIRPSVFTCRHRNRNRCNCDNSKQAQTSTTPATQNPTKRAYPLNNIMGHITTTLRAFPEACEAVLETMRWLKSQPEKYPDMLEVQTG